MQKRGVGCLGLRKTKTSFSFRFFKKSIFIFSLLPFLKKLTPKHPKNSIHLFFLVMKNKLLSNFFLIINIGNKKKKKLGVTGVKK